MEEIRHVRGFETGALTTITLLVKVSEKMRHKYWVC